MMSVEPFEPRRFRTAVAHIERRELTPDGLVRRALSKSSTSEAKIGARTHELAAGISALTAKLAPSGQFTEVVATQTLIATRG